MLLMMNKMAGNLGRTPGLISEPHPHTNQNENLVMSAIMSFSSFQEWLVSHSVRQPDMATST